METIVRKPFRRGFKQGYWKFLGHRNLGFTRRSRATSISDVLPHKLTDPDLW